MKNSYFLSGTCILFLLLAYGCGNNLKKSKDDNALLTGLPEQQKWGFKDFKADSLYIPKTMSGAAIQEAIDLASSNGGGTILLDSGVVEISKDINLRSNVKIIGSLNTDSSLSVTIRAKKKLYQALFVARGSSVVNTSIENLIIDGAGFDMHGVSFIYGTDNFLVCNCKIINIGFEKIDTRHDIQRAKNPTAINIWSEGDDYTDNFTIERNYVSSVAKHGINVNNGRFFILHDNYIEKAFMGWDASEGSKNAEIYRNEVVNCLFGAKTHGGENIIIHDNYHHNLDDTKYFWEEWADNSGTAFVLQGPGVVAVVENNIFSGTNPDKGIVYWDQDTVGISIRNNEIKSSKPIRKISTPQQQ